MSRNRDVVGRVALLALLSCGSLRAADADDADRADPASGTDGESAPGTGAGFDMSRWLLEGKGFLPVPVIITEPALGTGGGVALLYFRPPAGPEPEERATHKHVAPPNLYGGGYVRTSNGSRGAFGAASFGFRDDHLRYKGGAGSIDLNLDFYGIGAATRDDAARVAFTLDGGVSIQQVQWRLGESNNFIGARWLYLDLRTSLNRDEPTAPDLGLTVASDLVNSGLGISIEHDSRDNIFTPSRGWTGAIESLFYSDSIGSDAEFQTYRAYIFGYVPFADEWVLGMRGDYRAARGDAPFYQVPYVDLRGVPLGRYQDENVLVAEAELRWNVGARWALVGFAGAAHPWGRVDGFDEAANLAAGGVGVRYLLARKLGLYVGADAARGPEETAYYIQVGSAWR